MFKKILFFAILSWTIFFWISSAATVWDNKKPSEIITEIKDNNVQNTALDNVWWSSKWVYDTLDSIKNNSSWYIQWIWLIWLAIAFILIIYNGMMLLWNFTGEDKLAKSKKKFVSLILWVIILTSWFVIIKLVVSLISQIFS